MSRLAPMLCCPMTFAPTIQFGTPFGCLKVVFGLAEGRVDDVLDVVVHGYKREPRDRPVFDHPEGRAMVDDIAACQSIRHLNEVVRVALFYSPEITDRVIVVSILVRQRNHRGAFKRIWHHAIVLRVDEGRIHQLAAAANFLVADLHAPIDLPKHADRILPAEPAALCRLHRPERKSVARYSQLNAPRTRHR